MISPGDVGAEMLEMEEWEVAPGRIRKSADGICESKSWRKTAVCLSIEENSADNNTLDIAYSNTYLSSSQMIKVDPSVSFHVELVRRGSTHRFPKINGGTRFCSVAAGKLRVRIDEVEFAIGPQRHVQDQARVPLLGREQAVRGCIPPYYPR